MRNICREVVVQPKTKRLAAASLTAAAAFALLGLAAPAQAQPGQTPVPKPMPQEECFFPRNVTSFSAPDDHTVYLRVGASSYYKLDLAGICHNLTFAQGVELQSYRGAVAICSPLDAQVIVRLSGAFPDRCPMLSMHKLSPPEVAALGKNKP